MANIDKINVNGTLYNITDTTSGYITSAPVTSVNSKTGAVNLTASDVGALPSSTSIPTKTSDLTNDSGFLSSAVTTFNGQSGAVTYSAPVSSVNGQTGAVSLTATDVDALPDSTVIPTNVSELTNDSGYLTSDDVSRVALVGEYDALIGKPDLTVYKCVVVTSSSFSSLPQTLSNANLTANHVVVNSVLSNPSAQTSDWTITTSARSLSISGSISGSTTITLYLIEQR